MNKIVEKLFRNGSSKRLKSMAKVNKLKQSEHFIKKDIFSLQISFTRLAKAKKNTK